MRAALVHVDQPGVVLAAIADQPVAITFKGGAKIGCGSTIEFKSLKMKQSVKQGQSVTFKFTPAKTGEIAFACPMNMYRGKVVVK